MGIAAASDYAALRGARHGQQTDRYGMASIVDTLSLPFNPLTRPQARSRIAERHL